MVKAAPIVLALFVLFTGTSTAARSKGRQRAQISARIQPARSSEHKAARIPKTIHVPFQRSGKLDEIKHLQDIWQKYHSGWEIKFYDEFACLDFIEKEFPEYLQAWKGLDGAQRMNFFRYLVVLSQGGVAVESDRVAVKSLDDVLRPDDQLVLGYDHEYASLELAVFCHGFTYQRQLVHGIFGSIPGHQMLRELCNEIATSWNKTASAGGRVLSHQVGAPRFTEVAFRHARRSLNKDATSYIRFLPSTVWGTGPATLLGKLKHNEPTRQSFSTKERRPSIDDTQRRDACQSATLTSDAGHNSTGMLELSKAEMEVLRLLSGAQQQLFPISVDFGAPFHMLVPLIGRSERINGIDTAASLTTWGGWHYPDLFIYRPTAIQLLLQELSKRKYKRRPKVLLDIGAGLGMFSLAAAALGHTAVAFEVAPKNMAIFNASIYSNGFQDRITLHQAAAGNVSEELCLDAPLASSTEHILGEAAERGYGFPQLHTVTSTCRHTAVRRRPSRFLPHSLDVAAIRISAAGWEGYILDDLKDIIWRSKPKAILIEVSVRLNRWTGYGSFAGFMQQLRNCGYTRIKHNGQVCAMRKLEQMHQIDPGAELAYQDAIFQGGWCQLPIQNYTLLETLQRGQEVELVVFES